MTNTLFVVGALRRLTGRKQKGKDMQAVRDDSFVQHLVAKLPANLAPSFSDEQLLALKSALGGGSWRTHAVDLRWTLSFWRWHYYFVVLAGRNRRELTRRERELERAALAVMVFTFLTFSTLMGILVLYLVKSALGIDLIPGLSFGVWGWFQQNYLR